MNREIKFRVWNKKQERFIRDEHVNGYIAIDLEGSVVDVQNDSCETPWKLLENVILIQYTGLKDKNGKEIYEGDICEGHSDGIGVITWTAFDGGYDYVFDDGANVGIWEIGKSIEVIGNIYENHELLKA